MSSGIFVHFVVNNIGYNAYIFLFIIKNIYKVYFFVILFSTYSLTY